jgi:hypothetical protein
MPNRERRKSDKGLRASEEEAQEARSFVMPHYSSIYDNYKYYHKYHNYNLNKRMEVSNRGGVRPGLEKHRRSSAKDEPELLVNSGSASLRAPVGGRRLMGQTRVSSTG